MKNKDADYLINYIPKDFAEPETVASDGVSERIEAVPGQYGSDGEINMVELLSALYEYVKSGRSPLLEKSEHINKYENGTIYTMSLSLILWLRLEYKRTEWRKEKKYVTLKPMT